MNAPHWVLVTLGIGMAVLIVSIPVVLVPRIQLVTAAENIRVALPATEVKDVMPSPIAGLYQFKAGDNILYASGSGRYLVIGNIYDLQTAQDLTQPEVLSPSGSEQP